MGDVFFLIVFLPHNRKTWIYVKNYSYREPKGRCWKDNDAVSYTHLTLPTIA